MSKENPDYGRLVWTGLRQIQSLRDAVAWSLGGEVLFQTSESGEAAYLNEQTANKWLKTQGLPTVNIEASCRSLVGIISMAIDGHRRQLLGSEAWQASEHGGRTTFSDIKDFGPDRSGASWSDAANFCITSAFLRLLGAWEQFELDVLKSLYYYRPSGNSPGPEAERMLISPELELVYEEPIADPQNPYKLNYSFPPEWSDVKKDAENNAKRASFFKNQYGIVTIHGDPDKKQLKQNHKQYTEWYVRRNAIAHGRKRITMTLAEYLEADVFAYHAMTNVARQCLEKHKLLV